MRKLPFFMPVCVSCADEPSGQDIADIDQALKFLRDWPADRRGPVFQAAYNACTAAREGYLTVEEARMSLTGFARITGILKDSRRTVARGRADPVRHAH